VADHTAIITGASRGLGYECARALLERGDSWHVVLAVRDTERGRDAAARLGDRARCTVMRCDLASLESVRSFIAECREPAVPPIAALVCNAGLQVLSQTRRSADAIELTFAVNHLGHFALVVGLLDRLARPARVVIVSSGTHDPAKRTGMPAPRYTSAQQLAEAGADDADGDEPPETAGRRRYTTSKLCNVLFAYELDRRLGHGSKGVTVDVFDPGLMPGSGLARDYAPWQRFAWRFVLPLMRVLPHVHSTRASGERLAALAADPRFAGVSGRYFDGLKDVRSSSDSYDLEMASDLWSTSERLCGLRGPVGEAGPAELR
jgi:light-dependent protochlorophyllide reductase